MCKLFKWKRLLVAENNLLKYQLEEAKQDLENANIRIGILEGQCELSEELQDNLAKAENRNKRLVDTNQRLGDMNAAFRFKYGNLSKEDFNAWRDDHYKHEAERKEAKAEQPKQVDRKIDHDPYPEE